MELDSAGRLQAEVWLTVGLTYKVGLAIAGSDDPPDAFLWSEDVVAGINDATVTLDEWVDSGLTPTYVSSTSFTVAGDQTTELAVGRRLKCTTSGGTVYASIKTSSFSSVTTITVDDDALDAGLSAVSLSLIRSTGSTWSLPATPRAAITGNTTLAEASDFPSTKVVTATAVITLPAAARVAAGKPVRIKSSTTADVTIVRAGSDTIDGQTTVRIPSYDTFELESDGTSAWTIIRRGQWDVGDIKFGGYASAGIGWVAADASAINRTTYAGLFAVLSTAFGVGDGSTTFNVPDSRGRTVIGTGTGTVTESVTNAEITTGTDAITVASNADKWITGMLVTWTVTGTPPTTNPANLLDNADTVYVVRTNATTIKFATTLENAQNGTVIDITNAGSGTFTLTHTFTARTLADRGGEQAHAQSATELLAHVHSWGGVYAAQNGADAGLRQSGGASFTVGSTGGNAAMNIMQPYLALAAYIKT